MIRHTPRSTVIYSRRFGTQLYVFRWGLHFMLRRRNPRRFRHVRLILFERGKHPKGRGTWTFELSTWRTSPGSNRERIGLKAFVRFKIGLGGEVSEEYAEQRRERHARRGERRVPVYVEIGDKLGDSHMAHLRFGEDGWGVVAHTSDALLQSHGVLIDWDHDGRLHGIEFFSTARLPAVAVSEPALPAQIPAGRGERDEGSLLAGSETAGEGIA